MEKKYLNWNWFIVLLFGINLLKPFLGNYNGFLITLRDTPMTFFAIPLFIFFLLKIIIFIINLFAEKNENE